MRTRRGHPGWALTLGVSLVGAVTSCGPGIDEEAVWNLTGKVTGAVSAGVALQINPPNGIVFTATDASGAYAFHNLYTQ